MKNPFAGFPIFDKLQLHFTLYVSEKTSETSPDYCQHLVKKQVKSKGEVTAQSVVLWARHLVLRETLLQQDFGWHSDNMPKLDTMSKRRI